MAASLVKQFPLLRIVIPLILGVWIGQYTGMSAITWGMLSVLFFLWLVVVLYFFKQPSYSRRQLPGVFLMLFVFVFGAHWYNVRKTELLSISPVTVEAYISSLNGETAKNHKYDITTSVVWSDSIVIKQTFKGLLYVQKEDSGSALMLGQKILVRGDLLPFDKPLNPYAFDYSKYLIREGYSFRMWASSDKVVCMDSLLITSFQVRLGGLRESISEMFEKNGVSGEELSVLKAVYLGDRTDLDPEQKRRFSRAGVIHLLAVSGLHLGVIYLILISILRPLNRNKWRWLKTCITILVLWTYAFITGLPPSVLRAVIMFSMVELGQIFRRDSSIFNQLFASIFIIVLVDPYSIYKAGFWLSHAAVGSIVIFYPLINGWISFRFIVFRWLWSLVAVSLAAQVGTFALSIYYFSMFPNFFLLANILLMPLMGPILILSVISTCLIPFQATGILELFCHPLQDLLHFMIEAVAWLETLPGAFSNYIYIAQIELLLVGGFFIGLAMWWQSKMRQGFFVMLLAMCFLLTSMSFRRIQTIQRKSLVVFSQRGKTIINMVDARINKALLSEPMSELELDYVCSGFWARTHAPPVSASTLYAPAEWVCWGEKQFVILNGGEIRFDTQDENDVFAVIISGSPRLHISDCMTILNPSVIVAASNNKPWLIKKWKEEATVCGVRFVDVMEEGAWVFDSK